MTDPIHALGSGSYVNVGRGMTFDSRAPFTQSEMRAIRLRRRAIDAVDAAHDRVVRVARRLGIA